MRKLYGAALREDAGFTKVIKKVAMKNARILESRAAKHAPDLTRVAKEVTGSIEKVYEETAEVLEEFLNKCKMYSFLAHPETGLIFAILSQTEDYGSC